jgi:hypothetical protein
MAVKIVLSVLKEQVEQGMKRKELAKFYDLPESQMAKVLKKANLTIRKFAIDKFELVDDTINSENSEEKESNTL